MRKLLFFAVFLVTAFTFSSCKKAAPEVVGVGRIEWNCFDKTYCVPIGSETYPISTIIVPDGTWSKFIETPYLSPIRGAKVTIFYSQKHSEPQAILGAQTEDNIDSLYHRRKGRIYGVLAIILGSLSIIGGAVVLLLR
jgi:hypothetical protein